MNRLPSRDMDARFFMEQKKYFNSIEDYHKWLDSQNTPERTTLPQNQRTPDKMGFETDKRLQKKYGNHKHTAIVGGKTCEFDSDGEHKLADYLQLLKEQGYIKDWERESHNFILIDTSWCIDFTVRNNDNSFEYFEYKGTVEPRTKKLIMQATEFYPDAQITMVFANKKGWEKLGVRATSRCKRVCLLRELTKGLV